jgi:K+-transporting ATPase ATPase A chain
MTANGMLQIALYFFILLVCVKPLGWYIAQVYENKPCGLNRLLQPIEQLIYKLSGIQSTEEMGWKKYLYSMLIFNLFSFLAVYTIQRLQYYLPLNPQHFSAVPPDLSFNTAASFITNTDWQAYSGERTLSYFTQMIALTVQNFLSAATGISLLIAFIRGLTRRELNHLGNFWTDIVRGTLYILLPLAFILALILSAQGVMQNFHPYQKIKLLQPISYQQAKINSSGQIIKDSKGNPIVEKIMMTEQTIPMGPVASQVAIKQLGTNGGGFFNTNSAHPFENPTPISNFLEMLAILLIPAALCYTFGIMVKDKRQGWVLLLVMLILFLPLVFMTTYVEQNGNPAFSSMNIDQTAQANLYPGGNMEGKETRLGIVNSALWVVATTATANGSVNAMLDSFTPLGGLAPIWLMHLGEVIFGGVGSGLYGMLMLVIITVFVVGLMVGRTPEYLGKKIEPFEIKMVTIAVLIMPLIVLLLTAIASVTKIGISSIANPGVHGFSEILYAFTSMGNNNGSAFAGLNVNTPFYTIIGGIEMLFVRFWIAISVLAVAGSLARKKLIPINASTLPTHNLFFIILLISVIFILGALTFFPTLALGPVAEYFKMGVHYGH